MISKYLSVCQKLYENVESYKKYRKAALRFPPGMFIFWNLVWKGGMKNSEEMKLRQGSISYMKTDREREKAYEKKH